MNKICVGKGQMVCCVLVGGGLDDCTHTRWEMDTSDCLKKKKMFKSQFLWTWRILRLITQVNLISLLNGCGCCLPVQETTWRNTASIVKRKEILSTLVLSFFHGYT